MATTGEHPPPQATAEPELMKSLTLGIVGDLGRLLQEHGMGGKPMKVVEALIFSMFVVTETFVSARKGLEKARTILDRFHEDMVEYVFTEYFFKNQKARDLEEVNARFNQFNNLINERYQEYRQTFLEDFHGKQLSFRRTFTGLWQHLLSEPFPAGEEGSRLLSAFSVKLARFWSGCLSSFQAPPPEPTVHS